MTARTMLEAQRWLTSFGQWLAAHMQERDSWLRAENGLLQVERSSEAAG
jgi:hypothetical protein